MNERGGVIVAGGGIGGLAAALALSRAGWNTRLLERSPAFGEVGAGIQLGPNVVKILLGWGLGDALKAVAALPERLRVRSALSGKLLGTLPLGRAMAQRYGAPYATLHRADLHGILSAAVRRQTDVATHLARPLQSFSQTALAVSVQTAHWPEIECDALIGADGLWSTVRQQLLRDGPPRRTGHLAYRALLRQSQLPDRLRTQDVTAWLGPRMHLVHYPVRGGEWLNVVAIVQGQTTDDAGLKNDWDHSATKADLLAALGATCIEVQDMVQAIDAWRLWVLYDRAPMSGAGEHAQGRVALLGDAAHPMRPYLAQGAGMAIEDAAELGCVLAQARAPDCDVATLLHRYALNRWQRNARVQARALRNGRLFHARGLLRSGRDASLKLLGGRLLDIPWLYGTEPNAS